MPPIGRTHSGRNGICEHISPRPSNFRHFREVLREANGGPPVGLRDFSILGSGLVVLTDLPPWFGLSQSGGRPHRRRLEPEDRAGVSLTDMRLDFDDPALVGGLRTEEEVILAAIVRGRVALNERFAAFAEGSYGVLMLSTRT